MPDLDQLVNIWVVSGFFFLAFLNNAAMNIHAQVSMWIYVLIFFGL